MPASRAARSSREILLAFIVALALLLSLALIPDAAADSSGPFVRTNGTNLTVNGSIWYVYGAATYGTSNPGALQSIPDEISLARSAGLNTLRIVNMFDERGVDPDAPYEESAWTRVDQLLAAMHTAGLHAILDLSAFRNHLQNRELFVKGDAAIAASYPTPAGCAGRTGDDLARCVGVSWCHDNPSSCTDPYSLDVAGSWADFLGFVATRTNTVSGVTYRDDPTIAIVAFAGEPNPPNSEEPLKPGTQELTDFYNRVFDQWKAVDGSHLVTSGGLLHIDWEVLYGGSSGIDHEAIFALPNQDVLSIHNYFARLPATVANDTKTVEVATAAESLGKPWITEEFGFTQTTVDASTLPPTSYTESDRADWFRNVYEIQLAPSQGAAAAGVAFWNLGAEVAGASHDVNPGTPATWAVVRQYAPPPTGPEMVPPSYAFGAGAVVTATQPTKIPVQISWQGSDPVGVLAYQLQIQTDTGPWAAVSTPSRGATTTTKTLAFNHRYNFRARAKNTDGVWSGWSPGTPFDLASVQESDARILYAGRWQSGRASNYWGGSARSTTAAGANATVTFTGRAIAWIGTKGPKLGSSSVAIDGVTVGSTSQFASSAKYRTVIHGSAWSSTAAHTLTIRCLASAGHPRCDIDGLVIII